MTNASSEKQGMATSGVAMPEWLDRHDIENGAWTVEPGLPMRGVPCTNISERRMVVPFGGAEAHRLIRAHEMMHAKVSPVVLDPAWLNEYYGTPVSPSAYVVAEEMRVNLLCEMAGFDLDYLVDGSEKLTGVRLAQMGLEGWNPMVETVVSMYGSKAVNTLISGMRTIDPKMADLARGVVKRLRKFHRDWLKSHGGGTRARRFMSDTQKWIVNDTALPYGFVRYTIALARLVNELMLHSGEGTGIEQSEDDKRENLERTAKGDGTWATPILDKNVLLTRHLDGKIGRKRIASATGRNPRHLDRILTDPERRVFDRRARGKGGVVLIDQSGSMHLETEQIMAMVEAAPGCVIIGYSHAAGDKSGEPNIWVLANRGKVAESVREGNGGNGVDGPAIKFAASMRRTGEPFIWVCDGMVTDSDDKNHGYLTEECARLVLKHRIHQVGGPEAAIEALKRAVTSTLPTQAIGDIKYCAVWQASQAQES